MIEMIYPKGIGRRAKLWVDELPSQSIVPDHVHRQELLLTGVRGTGVRKYAAIETFHPRGGTFHYGLLGAELIPDTTGALAVVIPTASSVPDIRFEESLAGALDLVVVGGAPEYSDAIGSALQKASHDILPSGRLVFSAMAHGEIGSAPVVFEALTWAILRLLTRRELPQSAEDAAAFLAASC